LADAQVARPAAVAVAAGAAHSAALTAGGAVLAWRSADAALAVQEVGGGLAGKRAVAVSAGARQGSSARQGSTDGGDAGVSCRGPGGRPGRRWRAVAVPGRCVLRDY